MLAFLVVALNIGFGLLNKAVIVLELVGLQLDSEFVVLGEYLIVFEFLPQGVK